MTHEEAKRRIEICRDFLANNYSDMGELNFTAFNMAIQALSQEPCTVSVSEKEPNEITEEVTLRFFKNTLKVRWHDFVIYNVEWLKKNWQMEMDIVCGVKPCDDVVSREEVIECLNDKQMELDGYGDTASAMEIARVRMTINDLPSVTQKSGKWIKTTDRLPEDKTYVLTTIKVPNRVAHARSGWYQGGFFHNDNGDTWNSTDREVVAWMPLPNPCGAKMESEDKE